MFVRGIVVEHCGDDPAIGLETMINGAVSNLKVRNHDTGVHLTLRWRRQSSANSSLKPNSLLAGKIQGILFVWASECG
jgi:hypothetical protein